MANSSRLTAVAMGIDTHEEPVVYMRSDCDVCRSEGFTANTRLQVCFRDRTIIATLNVVDATVLNADTIGFSRSAWHHLRLDEGDTVSVGHVPMVRSLSALRKKIYGHALNDREITSIIVDISDYLYSDVEIAGFLTACAGQRLDTDETIALTRAMVDCGERLEWPQYEAVYDKHCVGGLPGNRTTPIVIAIVSAAGLIIPKTSSRSITSPAGTADTMEVMTPVDLTIEQMRAVVRETGACLAWGGRVRLSPTDEVLIRIERALDIDSTGQLVASVLSKKIAAGATHILIDIPAGATAKVRSEEEARYIAELFHAVADALGVHVRCVVTDGSQAVGNGIGPAEEAREVIAVLQNSPGAPADLAERSQLLAAHLLSMASGDDLEHSLRRAGEILSSGKAWTQFMRICEAQGGFTAPPEAPHRYKLTAETSGRLKNIDNRRLARLAKLAGAPGAAVAGIRLGVKLHDKIAAGAPLATLSAATLGELHYALAYYRENTDIFNIEPA